MDHDDLEKPMTARGGGKPSPRRRVDAVTLLAGLAFGALGVAGLWAVIVDDPFGGEPVATSSIERRAPPRPAAESAPAPERSAARQDGSQEAGKTESSRDGVPIVNAGEPLPKSGPVIIRVPGSEPSGPAAKAAEGRPGGAVETAMLEDSRYGQLPRIAADGRRSQDVYARRQPAASGPRVALVVGGLGVAREASVQAIKALSPEITLAFSPYGADVGALVAEARKDGHEVLLQAPMEPFAYPQNDPGPQTLLTSLPASANLERLRWSLGRASGYVGVAPLAGARFLEADDAVGPVFAELARRGVMFVSQGAKGGRVAAAAQQSGLAYAPAGAAIDSVPDTAAIDAALADLERDAKTGGVAVGWAGSTPLTLKRIEAWRSGLAARGVTLVPVSATLKTEGPS